MCTHCKAMASVDLHVIDGQLHNMRQKCRLSYIMSFVFTAAVRPKRRSSIIDTLAGVIFIFIFLLTTIR